MLHSSRCPRLLFLSVLLFLIAASAAYCKVVYVRPGGGDGNTGLSWALAKATIQAGIGASVSGDEVWVAAGTYSESITLTNGVALYGGFAGTETSLAQRNWTANITTLDGGGTRAIATFPVGASSATRLDGFLCQNAYTESDGGAVHCEGGSPTIANNRFVGNYAHWYGGAIYCRESSPSIAGNTFTDNLAGWTGGAIYSWNSSPTISNNVFTSNSSEYQDGGAVYCYGGSPAILSNRFVSNMSSGVYGGGAICCRNGSPTIGCNTLIGNMGPRGGAVACHSASPAIYSNYIAGNSAVDALDPYYGEGGIDSSYGGGICVVSAPSGTIANNTVTGNASEVCGGGIYCDGPLSIANNIVAFNSSGLTGANGPTLRNNCVYGNKAFDYSGVSAGTGDISVDPLLASSAYANPHIQPTSPCRNAGYNSAVTSGWTDIDGQARILPTWRNVDIGADESDGATWSVTPRIVRVRPDGNDANDGSSWNLAKTTVQSAVEWASEVGGEVWVQAGEYVEDIALLPYVYVYGGFAGTETARSQRNPDLNVSAVSPSWCGISSYAGCQVSAFDGFTIRDGGVYCCVGSPTIAGNKGGSIECLGSSALISGNTLDGDTIVCFGDHTTIKGNVIRNCGGDALRIGGGSRAINNVVCSNERGIYAYSYDDFHDPENRDSPTLASNVVYNNITGIVCSGDYMPILVTNNTVVGNLRTGIQSIDFTTMSNNIVAFNGRGIVGTETDVLRNNCVYNPDGVDYIGLEPGPGDISVDPQLVSMPFHDLHIQPTSPCRNAGYNSAVESSWVDMDGQARVQPAGGTVDIGADESDGTLWSFAPRVVRVKPDGDDANDGSSWPLAKRTVQAGIDSVTADGGEVWVAAGTYNERINYGSYVYLYGGFAGTETTKLQRDPKLNLTILDGQAGGTVVSTWRCGYKVNVLDGFTVRNGLYSYGSGVLCHDGWTVLNNNVITGNLSSYGGCAVAPASGFRSTAVTVTNCVISGNSGVGIRDESDLPSEIRNNIIEGNTGTGITLLYDSCAQVTGNTLRDNGGRGIVVSLSGPYYEGTAQLMCSDNFITGNAQGGISIDGGSPVVSHNVITGNRANYGAGVHCTGGSPAIFSNVIAGNTAFYQGGGVRCEPDTNFPPDALIANNTIIGNYAVNDGGGVAAFAGKLINNIIAFNSSGIYFNSAGSFTPVLRNNCVYGNPAYNHSGLAPGVGDISVDPMLVSVAHRDVHIQAASPCRNAGDSSIAQPDWTDIDGQLRVQPAGGVVDIGADESDGTTWTFSPSIVYVKSDGSDANDGSSWALAKRTVQCGIDAAARDGGEVWVKAGTYAERVKVRPYAHLYGGFAGSETTRAQRNLASNRSTLDGQQGGPVVSIRAGYTVTGVDGFTITNGTTNAYMTGSGIDVSGACPVISNNTVTGNHAASGAAICASSSEPVVSNNLVCNNTTQNGGAGGIRCSGYPNGHPVVVGNTVVGNAGGAAGGIDCAGDSTVANNIVAFNSSGFYNYPTSPLKPVLRNNCVFGNTSWDYSGLTAGEGDFSADPLFVNRTAGDYHLSVASPCVNSGLSSAPGIGLVDGDGECRITAGNIDVGWDECWLAASGILDAKRVADGMPVSLTAAVVTAGFGNSFYIETDNRLVGLRVEKTGHELTPGMRANVTGKLRTNDDGERYILATDALQNGCGQVAPMVVSGKALGGGDWHYLSATGAGQNGTGGKGLNNTGLLIRMCGRVTSRGDGFFHINDGSGADVKCVLPDPATLDPTWDYVAVTGISSREVTDEIAHPVLRVPNLTYVTHVQ